MRITSGILKNRTLNILDVDFRPTMESVREAIFSSLGEIVIKKISGFVCRFGCRWIGGME